MEDFHPAACVVCCKQAATSAKHLPEPIYEFVHLATQLAMLLVGGALGAVLGVGAILLILTGQFKPRPSRQQAKKELQSMRDSVNPGLRDIVPLHVSDLNAQINFDDDREMYALEYQIKNGNPDQVAAAAKRLATVQAQHVNHLKVLEGIDHQYGLRSIELNKIGCEIDAITRKPFPSEHEMERLMHLCERFDQVQHERDAILHS